jgi:hypothetical protein
MPDCSILNNIEKSVILAVLPLTPMKSICYAAAASLEPLIHRRQHDGLPHRSAKTEAFIGIES